MKGIVPILVVGMLMPVAALAQEWKAYTNADPGFTIEFPGVPAVQNSRIKNASGVSLPLTRYEVRAANITYTLAVTNYSSTNSDALGVIAETERAFSATGKVTASRGARIRRHFGRNLILNGADGTHSDIAIFFVDKHLYTLIGQAMTADADQDSDNRVRFLESLEFTDDDGGFGSFFGGGGSERAKSTDRAKAEDRAKPAERAAAVDRPLSADRGSSTSTSIGRPRTDATCVGKSAGDAVQLETPSGPVAATCTLVARPNASPGSAPVQ